MHDKSVLSTLAIVGSNSTVGLSSSEVERSASKNGYNTMPTSKPTPLVARFFGQFKDILIIILLASAVISAVLAFISGDGWAEPFIIVSIVVANAVLGTVQQFRTDKALKQLDSLATTNCNVLRNGSYITIDSKQLVVGDIISLTVGNVVPADCRIINCHQLEVNEASLTGESLPVAKRDCVLPFLTPIAERCNCLFGGSFVTGGKCQAVVYSVGLNTEIGAIASQLASTSKGQTPLQIKLDKLGKVIGVVCLAVCALVFGLGVAIELIKGSSNGIVELLIDNFIVAISLAVAAIPEGLPAIVTLVLARGVQRMAKVNCVVKNLTAVETLGSARVICTDKTGTLTHGQLSVSGIYAEKFEPHDSLTDKQLQAVQWASLCCDVVQGEQFIGDPIEVAIVRCASSYGAIPTAERLFDIPFDSNRKKMTVVVSVNGKNYAVTKGSIDNLPNVSDRWKSISQRLCQKGLRVIALSVMQVSGKNFDKSIESSSNVIALIATADTLREGAKNSVNTCIQGGIKPIMLTGDSVDTARAIAQQVGILREGNLAIDSKMLASMSDSELNEKLERITVYARVTPSDKVRIVSAWQGRGCVTAMTGDGVNDAVALRKADIGCAMGSGTDVAKESADMVMLDDNFGTIVEAVAEGRTVYDNIVKSVKYLLACNIGEVICVVASLFLFGVSPLCAMQLLWVNLVTDGLPSLALGLDGRHGDIMRSQPNDNKGFFANGQGIYIALLGLLVGGITVVAYTLGSKINANSASTMAFIVLSLSQLLLALELRSKQSIFKSKPSMLMIVSLVVSGGLMALVCFVPALSSMFMLTNLPLNMYAVCLVLSAVPMQLIEVKHLAVALSAK